MAIKNWLALPTALALTACVTINVYFPAAEAREAAREFVDKVIGEEAAPAQKTAPEKPEAGGGMSMLMRRIDPWSLLGIGTAHAQSSPDISINTPAIRAIQSQMQSRFDSTLRAGFDTGALGFTSDGMVTVRDASKLELKDRVAMNAAVADDNRDRKALYREVAVANGHPEWEAQIRDVFARQWIERARSGWWYQTSGGWKQK
ncbi:hypothetical protein CO614_08220 [Lysobacteraceae bacterium NML120232]|nr:hypothetical protein CO614_08220 [Xanthomonadaceae bacterium NML120232]